MAVDVDRTEVGANCAGVAGDGAREDTVPEAGLGLANAVEDIEVVAGKGN